MELSFEQRKILRQKKIYRGKIISILAPSLTILLLLVIWEGMVVFMNIPSWKIPKPTAVFVSMVVDFKEILPHIIRSYFIIIFGFLSAVVIGITMAALLSNYKILAFALTPYINLLCTTPVITLVPLLLLMFGFSPWVLVFAVALQAFPIIVMNAVTGFLNVQIIRLELMGSLRANRIQTFFYCTLPASLPSVFTGMKLSVIFSTIACVSSEFTGGNDGLGANIIAFSQFMRMDKAFACIFFVAIIGLIMYGLTSLLESKLVKWKI